MGFIDKILGSGIKDVVGGVAEIADKFITSPDEKKAFQLEVEKLQAAKQQSIIDSAQNELDSYLKDVQSARESNTQIQVAEKSSWLAKNIAYMIDIIVTIMWASLTFYIIGRIFKLITVDGQPDMTAVMGIYAAVTASFTTILSFHRGSSAGSATKDKQINSLIANR